MCKHEFESLRTADGSFCMTACRKCMKSTGEIETLFKAENRIAAANARIASLEKQNSDMLPYYQDHCEGALIPATEYQQWIKRAEQAEEQCAAMQAVIEYLSMRYSLCVQILPNGAWQVENQKRATEFAALEEKP